MIVSLAARWLRGTYYEPFLGGGAVFFRFQPARAVLSDINPELINTYLAVQRNPDGIIGKLKKLEVSEKEYYRIRSSIPRGLLNQAARVLYLNRTAFGGIYRLNQVGHFNVPYGGGERTPNLLWDEEILVRASKALAGAVIKQSDFERVLDAAREGDVVYCDPTYTVTHDSNCFVRYNERNFAWADQLRLAAAASRAVKRGAAVLVSNAHHQALLELYAGAKAWVLARTSCVSRDVLKRRRVREYLFILHPSRRSTGRGQVWR
jgi:DNA adenine methylase